LDACCHSFIDSNMHKSVIHFIIHFIHSVGIIFWSYAQHGSCHPESNQGPSDWCRRLQSHAFPNEV